MASWEDRDSRFKRLELKTGLLVLVVLLGMVVLIVFLGVERGVFTKKYSIYFITESVAGFSRGMPVNLSGFRIGRIKGFELIEGAKVKVTAEISRKHQQWLRAGSKARLAKEGYIGDTYVEIIVGEIAGGPLSDGAFIPYEKTGGVEELIKEALPVLEAVKEIIHYINDPEGDIKTTLGNFKVLTSDLLETKARLAEGISDAASVVKKLDAIVDKFDEKGVDAMDSALRVFKNLEGLSLRLAPTMEKIELIADHAEKAMSSMPATSRKLGDILDDVKKLTGTISEDGPALSEILSDAQKAARGGKEIVRGVKKSWPMRLMLPPKKRPELVPLDSFLFERKGYDLD
jgi:phospholipid/cholesterol/gamma-HCH transport system substrate-binding protein